MFRAKQTSISGAKAYVLREEFDGVSFSRHLQTLRVPLGERASLKARPGWLRLYGAESPQSNFCPAP